MDGITYRKGITEENPLLIKSELSAPYNYGQVVNDDTEWWRPTTYATATQVEVRYTEADFGRPGISGLNSTGAGGVPTFTIEGAATDRLPSLAIYTIKYSITMDATNAAQ